MKIAVLGTGKTGGKVVELARQKHDVTEFNIDRKPTLEDMSNQDVVISFLPGLALNEYFDMLIQSGTNVVIGSTGADWPENLDELVKNSGAVWVSASNFAIGMNIVRLMIGNLSKASDLFEDAAFSIHEVHHTKKKDAPSGTALTWKEWLDRPAEITSDRVGDVVGEHEVTLETEYETITLAHSAKDRKIFARGAIWTAEYIHSNSLKPGSYTLEEIMNKELGYE